MKQKYILYLGSVNFLKMVWDKKSSTYLYLGEDLNYISA